MSLKLRPLAALAVPLAMFAAAASAQPAAADHRLRTVLYDPQQVVRLRAALGYQMMIAFDPLERIENVAIGDSTGWQAVASRRGDLLFLKPMDSAPATNMTVVTNLRRYSFELSVRKGPIRTDDPDLVYSLHFVYPPPATAVVALAPQDLPRPPRPPEDVNHAYSYEGAREALPERLFDDGASTYFRFPDGTSLPAIFALEADGSESVVNFHLRDGYVVVDRLARGFVLRRGKVQTRLFNDGFQAPEPGRLSPRPRNASGAAPK